MLSIVTVLSAVDLHKTGQIGSRQNSGETEKQFGETFGTENSRTVFTMIQKYIRDIITKIWMKKSDSEGHKNKEKEGKKSTKFYEFSILFQSFFPYH